MNHRSFVRDDSLASTMNGCSSCLAALLHFFLLAKSPLRRNRISVRCKCFEVLSIAGPLQVFQADGLIRTTHCWHLQQVQSLVYLAPALIQLIDQIDSTRAAFPCEEVKTFLRHSRERSLFIAVRCPRCRSPDLGEVQHSKPLNEIEFGFAFGYVLTQVRGKQERFCLDLPKAIGFQFLDLVNTGPLEAPMA